MIFLEIIILSYKGSVLSLATGAGSDYSTAAGAVRKLFEFVSGYGLGGSTVALFGRVGGGIYTKAADVGADLAGKVGEHLEEDSPLNPGTIADNVGDNVGDIAGMGADLFGSLAESTCAALVVSTSSFPILTTDNAVYFPLLVTSVGILASAATIPFGYLKYGTVEFKLKVQLIVSTILMSLILIPTVLVVLPPGDLEISFANTTYATT